MPGHDARDQMPPGIPRKALAFPAFGTWLPALPQNLIKPVESNAFWGQNAEMTLRTIEKALGKQCFQSGKTRTQKTLKTVSKTLFCEDAKCVAKTLIKPVDYNVF